MTQCELANLIGTTNVTISRYISGDRSPRIEIIVKIAEFFNVSIDYLLVFSNTRFVNDFSNYSGLSKIEYKLIHLTPMLHIQEKIKLSFVPNLTFSLLLLTHLLLLKFRFLNLDY